MEKSIKLYIDTSVWNFALETERTDCLLTWDFFRILRNERSNYTVLISDLVEDEMNRASSERKKELAKLIDSFSPEVIQPNKEEILSLANTYISEKLIPVKYRDDAMHIAIASLIRCDFLVSWNFKHIVKAKVIKGVHMINLREGYALIELVSPRQFLGK